MKTTSQVANLTGEIIHFVQEHGSSVSSGKPLISVLIDTYSHDYIKTITDTKLGNGASDYIVKAFQYYLENTSNKNE